jgi:hypothetical protein
MAVYLFMWTAEVQYCIVYTVYVVHHPLTASRRTVGPPQRPYIYLDPRRGPPVRLGWLEADCNTLGGGKTGYLK